MPPAGAPWWAFILTAGVAILAIGVSLFSLWYNLKRTDEREHEKWVKTSTLDLVSEFLSVTFTLETEFVGEGRKNKELNFDNLWKYTIAIRTMVAKAELLQLDELHKKMREITQNQNKYVTEQHTAGGNVRNSADSIQELNTANNELIKIAKKYIQQKNDII